MIFNDNTTTIRYGRRLVTHKSRTLHESRHPHTTIFSDRHSDETRMIGYIHSKSIKKGIHVHTLQTHAYTRGHTRSYTRTDYRTRTQHHFQLHAVYVTG